MFESLANVVQTLRDVVGGLDAALLTGADAARGVRVFAELERLAAAGRTLLAARVEETKAWDGELPVASVAEWLAQVSGTSVGAAIGVLETSRDLESQPVVADALRDGKLSTAQVVLVSGAVKAAPDAAESLVATASRATMKLLGDTCRATKARADDPAERTRRHYANRRTWFANDPDGMIELRALLPVPEGAAVRTILEKRTDQIFRERNRAGLSPEPRQAYMSDALVELLRGGTVIQTANGVQKRKSRAVRADIQVRVDLAAIRRGWVEAGEICDAPGVGELTVEEVERLMAEDDAVIRALLTNGGTEPLKIVKLDRSTSADMRRAVAFRDPVCVNPACGRHFRTERDHTADGGFAKTRRTRVDELAPLCDPDHKLKTRHGWVLARDPTSPTGWSFNPPEPRAQSG